MLGFLSFLRRQESILPLLVFSTDNIISIPPILPMLVENTNIGFVKPLNFYANLKALKM